MPTTGYDFRVLGPLGISHHGDELALGGPRQRLILALLVLNAERHIQAEHLVELVWGDDAPASGTGPLRTYIWQLRRLLDRAQATQAQPPTEPAPLLHSRDGGYVLDIPAEQIDLHRFEQAFQNGRAAAASGHPQRALGHLDDALALWQGNAFGELASAPALRGNASRLDQLRLAVEELRAEMRLETGQHASVAPELAALTETHPEHEGLWALLMTALYRAGRQHEALQAYQQARTQLIETVGIEPGPQLRQLEQAVLSQDPSLDWKASERSHADPDTPPARSAPHDSPTATSTNLPHQLTSFVGRDEEVAAVADAVSRSRLVTLTGSGGCGKTRLALAVGTHLADKVPGGVWFVDLGPVTQPDLVPRAVAQPLGVESDQLGQLDHIVRRVGDRSVLLIVDNCEHLVDAVAKAVDELLTRCPNLQVLATSREELDAGAELVWRVPALRLPPRDTDQDGALAAESVQLFVERGRASLAEFSPTDEALQAVVQICRRLDGIPLAIELAAALVGSLPVPDIAARLHNRLGLLSESRRRGPERHRTLRATLDWSYELLNPTARELLVSLSVFVGDFTLDAAEAVTSPDSTDPLATARGLGHLVRTSMINVVTSPEGAQRYRMLETVRHYAGERLIPQMDADELRRRHARFYAELAAEAERHVHGPGASEWLGRMNSELPNLRAALAWAFAHDELDTGVRLAGSLSWWVARMALLDEAAGWLEAGLDHRNALSAELRLLGLIAAATVAFSQGEFRRAGTFGEEGTVLAREVGDSRQLAIALIVRGAGLAYEGDLARATECFEEARILCERRGDRWGRAWMLTCWATASRRAGDLARSREQLTESLQIFRDLGDEHGQVLPLVNLAFAAQVQGKLDEAIALAVEADRLATALGDRQLRHIALCLRGRLELARSNLVDARDLLVHSIHDFPGAHSQLMVAIGMEGLAELAARASDYRTAAALWGFTHELRTRARIGASGNRTDDLVAWLEKAQQALGHPDVEAELARGRRFDLDEAVDLAIASTQRFAATNTLP